MKNSILIFLFIICNASLTIANTTIHITNGEWEPYLSEYCYEYGLASHIVSEAFKLEGINIKWGFFPWIRSYEIAKRGQWDASAVWWPTKDTRAHFWVSETVVKTSFVFYYIKGNKFQWKSIEDLKGLHIGFTRGYDYGKEFMSALKEKKIVVETTAKDELNFTKLLHGRLDIFPNDPIVGYAQIRNTFEPKEIARFTHHPKEFEKNTLNLIISKKCKNGRVFLEKFNSGLKKLKKSARFEQMFNALNTGKYDKQKTKWKEQTISAD
jgi:polar amino acid transport system substrate-binding protein